MLFNEIGIISQLSGTRFRDALPPGLSPAQFFVLNNFVRLGGTRTPSQLAAAFQVTKGAMTNTLRRLAAKDLVVIAPDPADGRGKRVSITAKGRRMRHKAISGALPRFADIAQLLDGAETAQLVAQLQRLRKFLDENR